MNENAVMCENSVGSTLFLVQNSVLLGWEHSFLITSENILSVFKAPRWVDILDLVENKIAYWPDSCFLWEYCFMITPPFFLNTV